MTDHAWIERYLPLARKLARRYAVPGLTREDVQQEACLALVEAVRELDVNASDLSGHLRNRILQHLKGLCEKQTYREGRVLVRSDLASRPQDEDGLRETDHDPDPLEPDDPHPGPFALACSSELLEQIRQQLPPRQAFVLEQTYWHGQSDQQIATSLGATVNAVRLLRRKGILRCRDMFWPS